MLLPRSIRVRLTVWYFTILAAILVLFSAGIYLTLRRTLDDSLNDSLRTRAAIVESSIEYDAAGRPSLDLPTNENDPSLGDSFERVFDASGEVVFDNSQVFGATAVEQGAIDRALQSREQVKTFGSGETQARILTQPLIHEGRVAGILQVAQATSDFNDTLRNLLVILGIGCPAALVLASFGGWWLASRALAPIDHVTRLAQEITGQDLSRRLNLDLPDDEVGRLARTFDGMISRLDAMFQRQHRFTADASHELRTPLTAIRGQIDVVLQRPRDPAAYRQVLASVNEHVDRMTRLVGGLLMLARADAGALPLEREWIPVGSMIEAVAEQVMPLAESKGLRLEIASGVEVDMLGDEDLLLQLMLNLADNAIKYTAAGSVTLGWRTRPDAIELYVDDTGAGIPDDQRELIFERFHRVDGVRSNDGGGAGLGLAICKWIAEAHGGHVRLESNGDGSTFVVDLPTAC